MIRVIVDVSDLHCGSTVGLLPPDFVTFEGNEVKQNAIQRWLWKCWTDMRDNLLPQVLKDDPFAVVFNGDLIEGVHHGTKQVITPNTDDHSEAAYQCVAPFCMRAEKIFFVEGTECHVGNSENSIARRFKAVPDPETGKFAWPQLRLTAADTLCVFRHHIGTSIRSYLSASQLGINLGDEQLRCAKAGHRIPKVLDCAHRHETGKYEDSSGCCVTTGAWQVLTRHGHKVVGAAHGKCSPGVWVLDWRNRDDNSVPELHKLNYPPPESQGAVI